MRLQIIEDGLSPLQKLQMKLIHKMMAGHVPGPIPALSYRAGFFGKQFNDCVQTALRKATVWHKSEAELFAAFVSYHNTCQFCLTSHTAVTSKGLDAAIVQAVLEDWRTAPVSEKVRATLGFLEKLTRTPELVSPDDITAMKAAGVSQRGIEEAIYICFVFCTINRLANSFDFELANEKSLNRVGFVLYNMGYGIGCLPG
jgi:uncharacterized peroxidase-related enzyme